MQCRDAAVDARRCRLRRALSSSSAFAQCVGTATGPGAGPPAQSRTAICGSSLGRAAPLGCVRQRARQHPHRFPEPAGQRLRFGARRTRSPTSPAAASGPRRRRRGHQQVHQRHDGNVSGGRRLRPGARRPIPTYNCDNSVRVDLRGMQVGSDIARLNVSGWNLHLGTTAGYLVVDVRTDNAADRPDFQVPFFGIYAVATYGRFFADVMVRQEFYSANLTNTPVGLFNQQVGAQRLLGRGIDWLQFRAGQQLVHRAFRRLYLVANRSRSASTSAAASSPGRWFRLRGHQRDRKPDRTPQPARRNDHRLRQHDLAAVRVGQRVSRVRRQHHFDRPRPSQWRGWTILPGPCCGIFRSQSPAATSPPASEPTASIRSVSPARSPIPAGSVSSASTTATATTRRLDRQRRHPLPVHAGAIRGDHAAQGPVKARARYRSRPTGPASTSAASSAWQQARPTSGSSETRR